MDPLRKDWIFQYDLLPVVGHEENIRRKEARKTDQGKNEDQNFVKLVSVARHDHIHDKLKRANARNQVCFDLRKDLILQIAAQDEEANQNYGKQERKRKL